MIYRTLKNSFAITRRIVPMESSRPTVQTLFESGQAVVDSAGGFIILMAKVDGHIMIFSIIRQFLTYDPFPKVTNYHYDDGRSCLFNGPIDHHGHDKTMIRRDQRARGIGVARAEKRCHSPGQRFISSALFATILTSYHQAPAFANNLFTITITHQIY